MLDSGCTQHMIGDLTMFNSINTNDINGVDSITFGDNGKGKVKGIGVTPDFKDKMGCIILCAPRNQSHT